MSVFSGASNNGSRSIVIVKQYFKKPMTLVVAILSLVTIVADFMLSSKIEKFGEEFLAMVQSMTGQEVEMTTQMGANSFGYIISGIITLCIFMIFLSSLSSNGGPTIWFTILHVLSVLQLIFTAIGALFVVVLEVVFIFSTKTLVQYAINSDLGGLGSLTDEQIEALYRQVSSFRTSLLIVLLVTLIIYGIVLYYINSQTAFLKSVTLTCKNPQLKYKGAVPYGNLSIAIGVIELIGVVILYLMINPDSGIFSELDMEVALDFSPIMTPYLIYSISGALYVVLRGYFAKGWEKFAKENEDSVYETVGASTRKEVAPMETYKSTTRSSHEARQQSQPYLIGEEEDPNKKSSYIPEELQNDYNQQDQMYGAPPQQGGFDPFAGSPYGGGNPYGGNPYGQPAPPQQGGFGGAPYGGDPFGQSPMGGSNPYGGGQGGGYNNGMM